MKLTPLDIRKQEFSRRVRGVDEEEVKAFLQMIASQWDEVHDDHRRLEEKVRDLEGKLEHYKRVEEALQEALRTARENAKDQLETAKQKAQIIIQEAEANATHIKRDADDERRKMKRQIARLSHRRDEIISRLRAFLMSEMEMLARFDGDDGKGFLKLAQHPDLAQETDPEPLDVPVDMLPPEPEQLPEPEFEEEEEEIPEAPLPAWAQFEGELEPGEDQDLPAEDVAESWSPEPPAVAGYSPDEPVADSYDAPESYVEPPADVPPEPVESAWHEVDADQAEYSEEEPEPVTQRHAFLDFSEAGSSDGDSVDHHAPLSTDEVLEQPDFQMEVDAEPEAELPSDQPVPESGTPAMAKWLNDHFFSGFRKNQPAQAVADEERDEVAEEGVENRGWEEGQLPQKPVEEEEESFTVSSEEVERIRRILKGLD